MSGSTSRPLALSDTDLEALRQHSSDLTDIPEQSQLRFENRVERAYASADLISQGLRNPLSRYWY